MGEAALWDCCNDRPQLRRGLGLGYSKADQQFVSWRMDRATPEAELAGCHGHPESAPPAAIVSVDAGVHHTDARANPGAGVTRAAHLVALTDGIIVVRGQGIVMAYLPLGENEGGADGYAGAEERGSAGPCAETRPRA